MIISCDGNDPLPAPTASFFQDKIFIEIGEQITFTSTKLITSENRIEVDFEYTNSFQRYGRNLVGLSSRGQNLANRINYDIRLFREWDDTNNLLYQSRLGLITSNTPNTDFKYLARKKHGWTAFCGTRTNTQRTRIIWDVISRCFSQLSINIKLEGIAIKGYDTQHSQSKK